MTTIITLPSISNINRFSQGVQDRAPSHQRLHMSYKPIWICTIRDEELTDHRKIYLEHAKTENSYNKLFPNQVSNRLDVSWSSRKSCLWLVNKLEKANQSNVIGLCKFIETTTKPWPATINVPPEKYDVNSMKVKTTN